MTTATNNEQIRINNYLNKDVTETTSIDGRGTTHIKMNQQPAMMDCDEPATNEQQARASALNANFKERSALASDDDYQRMTPTEKRAYLEQVYIPKLQQLTQQHRESCDFVESFQNGEQAFKVKLAGQWCNGAHHPGIRQIVSNGQLHFASIVKSGAMTDGGYKLVETRGNMTGTTTLICIPQDVPSLMHYADSEQCKAYADAAYQRELASLTHKRDRAAIALTTCQRDAETAWNAIQDITSFFSKIKKAKQ